MSENTESQTTADQSRALVMQPVSELCAECGITLTGLDGQPYHCGERMSVRSGIIGADYAECKCGLKIGNLASPHINGGCIPNDEWLKEHGDNTWVRLSA